MIDNLTNLEFDLKWKIIPDFVILWDILQFSRKIAQCFPKVCHCLAFDSQSDHKGRDIIHLSISDLTQCLVHNRCSEIFNI